MEAVEETERGFPALSCLAYHFRAPPAQGVERVGGMTDSAEGGGQVEHGIEDAGWLARQLGGVAQACACRPRRVMLLWSAVTTLAAVSLMVMPMRVLKDPVSLWSAAGSRSATDRAMFDAAFGPFWRTQMFIIRPQHAQGGRRRYERGRGWRKEGSSGYGEGGRRLGSGGDGSHTDTLGGNVDGWRGIASPYTLKSVLDLQVQMESLRVWCGELVREDDGDATQEAAACEEGESWGVEDLCYQPTPGAGCIVQSALEFWQMNWTRLVGSDVACASLLPAPYYTPANASVCEMALRARMNRCAIYGPSEVQCWSRAGIPLVQPNILFAWPVDQQEGVHEQEPPPSSASTSTSNHTPRQRVMYQESRSAPETNTPPPAQTPADAEALIVTYLFNNDAWSAVRAAVWEAKVMALLGAPLSDAPLLRAASTSTNPHNSDADRDREAGGAGATYLQLGLGGAGATSSSPSSKYAWQDELNVSFSVERATRDEVAAFSLISLSRCLLTSLSLSLPSHFSLSLAAFSLLSLSRCLLSSLSLSLPSLVSLSLAVFSLLSLSRCRLSSLSLSNRYQVAASLFSSLLLSTLCLCSLTHLSVPRETRSLPPFSWRPFSLSRLSSLSRPSASLLLASFHSAAVHTHLNIYVQADLLTIQ
jgi:hypothetical protein